MPIRARLLLGFALVCLALVAAPLTIYMVQSTKALQSARLKYAGIGPSKALLRLVQLLQQHRGLSAGVLGGNITMEAQRVAKQLETDKAVEAVEAIVRSEISDAALAADWRRAAGVWKELASGVSSRAMSGQESFAKHTALIGDNLKLLDLMLDYFGLSYDPSGNDYHLTMALLVHMPTLTEFLGQAGARGMLLLAEKRITLADRTALIGLISNVERQHEYMARELDKAVALNSRMKADLGHIAQGSIVLARMAIDLAKTQVVDVETLRYSPIDYFAIFTQAIDGQFALLDQTMVHLEEALRARMAELQGAQVMTIGFIVCVIAFAVWLGTVIVRAIRQDITALQQGEEAQRRHAGELEITVERLQQAHSQIERQLRELMTHQRRWEWLHRLDLLLSQSLRLEDIYPAFARAVKALVPYDRIGVIVPEGTRLRMALSVAEPPLASHQGKAWSQAEDCAAKWVLDHKAPRLSQDLKTEATYWDELYLAQNGIRSTISVPLLAGGEGVGVLCLDHRMPQSYSHDDLELLGPMAEQLALAIQNARLYEAQRQATDELAAKIEEMERMQFRLIEAERLRAMGQLAAGVAHDFNNALMGVLGQTQLMRLSLEQGPVGDPPRSTEGHTGLLECLARQERAIHDAAETIRKIREATRPMSREAFGPVALGEIAEQVLAISRPRWKDQAEAAGVQIAVRTVFAEAPPVLGNAAELREAITNLLFNALDAMSHGGTVTIAVRQAAGDVVDLSVTDTGVGMSQEVQARLFEPFYTTKGARGTGLGLSMVHGIISRHQGVISVQSAEGQGTTITLRLPVAQAAAEAIPSPAIPLSLPAPLTLLVIDDDPVLAETLRELLCILGHEAVVATSGEEGLARLAAERFDLVMTDLGMPGMSGWEVAQAVQARWPQLPVILVTGWGDAIEHDRLDGTGVDAALAKPYTVAQLQYALAAGYRAHPAGRGEQPMR